MRLGSRRRSRLRGGGTRGLRRGLLLALATWMFVPSPPAEAAAPAPGDERVRVAASDRYGAGRVHRFALGGGYRDLWMTPIELPVLDLAREGGGLEPIGRFGGLQTAVLGFEGRDGRSYSFRGTDKDPSAVLDPLLRDTIVQVIVQDQMAAQHPAGALAAGELTRAAEVLTVQERLVVMPDDPRLGEYREEFAGMVGTFFVYPQPAEDGEPGFADAVEILDHDELYERLRAGYEVDVDERAFLRARLMDLLLGDFDRHRKQWRWARIPGQAEWQPIPEDRDQAFVRYDGAVQRVMRIYIPILQNYAPTYPRVKGLTLHGWEQDRWLLPSLEWPVWAETVEEIQASLSDDVIARAVDALPFEYAEIDGARLAADVAGRRDALGEVARRFYLHLARQVDVQLTDAAETVRVEHARGGATRVEVESGGRRFARTFLPDETDEVRVHLRGSADEVVVRGGAGRILLRVVAEDGEKTIDDRAGGATRVYAGPGADPDAKTTRVLEGRRTRVDRRAYTPPEPDAGFVDVEGVPPRDWGTDTIPLPLFGYEPDVGLFLGVSVAHTRYGFRKHPFASRHTLEAGWAFEAKAPRVAYVGQFRPENSKQYGEVRLDYSGIEVLRYYGEGNETSDEGSDRYFRVRNQQYRASFDLVSPLPDERFRVSGGPYLHVSRTARGVRLIDGFDRAGNPDPTIGQPYGNHDFGVLGVQAHAQFDTRRSLHAESRDLALELHDNVAAGYPTSGVLAQLTAQLNPPLWDVSDLYGSLRGSIAGYTSFLEDDRVTLALRVGAHETFGRTPYFDQAAIGGGRFFSGPATNRGFRARRFQGDTAVFGNADLRIVVARMKIIVPGDLGVHGFFDVGRVWVNDQTSDNWHPSGGAGLWFAPLVRTNAISFSFANSPEETLFYMRLGFHY